ncbi:type II toxin-antitoxin system PemK/MazF family toxin [Pseudomonas sp. HR96]|uniref:type II toxin-antitoxin system PemK/MazF family toxin n=1 Tax=Pseudomonas sp. HR96 TaxID=1027966 RepID=UPI002A755C5D|nr:type II toxin-antitoxin system PemK/MazF family toxin [Pseudomonas sp. HR96]WPO98183.1 type II toxin-antitoxin system PemK/MazF family toxin [Pseudomonas sp. HR96]
MISPRPFTPLPAPGDIVWCKFPERLGTPGPKSRPGLVIGVFDEERKVRVCYGTSQKTDRIYPGEFVLDPDDDGFPLSGLGARTKFDLNHTFDLAFDTDWFAMHSSLVPAIPLPKMGSLHSSYMQAIKKAQSR